MNIIRLSLRQRSAIKWRRRWDRLRCWIGGCLPPVIKKGVDSGWPVAMYGGYYIVTFEQCPRCRAWKEMSREYVSEGALSD